MAASVLKPGQYQGKPCKRGHAGIRYSATRNCVACDNERKAAEPKAKKLATQARYEAAHPGRQSAARRAYFERNRGKWLVYCQNRRALRINAPGKHTDEDILDLAVEQNFRCAYCPAPIQKGMHIDHRTPLSRGGSNWPSNLQITCAPCNLSKNDSTHEEYLERLRGKNGTD